MPPSRHTSRAAAFLATLVVTLLAACGGGTAVVPSIDTSCPPVDIRDRSGAPIDLTGAWSGNDQGHYRLRQIDSCLTWVGLSDFDGQSLGDAWVTTFRGMIAADRTISGEFLDVSGTDPGSGTLTLRIDDSADALGGYVIDRVSATGSDYGGTFWERVPPAAADTPVDLPSPGAVSPSATPGSTLPS